MNPRARMLILPCVLAVLFSGATALGTGDTFRPELGPRLRGLDAGPTAWPARPYTAAELVPVFLVGPVDHAALRTLGVRLDTQAGPVTTARVPRRVLPQLTGVAGLRQALLATPLESLLDRSLAETRADMVRNRTGDAWTGTTGAGVVIGLIDSGLDVTHPDFRHPDGSTRILAYWDQGNDTGTPPGNGAGEPLYGTLWTQEDIDNGLHAAQDSVGHGTHVAGIAAGTGRASQEPDFAYRYSGVAPEADLVVVSADLLLDTGVVDALDFVFRTAGDLGRPAVANLSLGTQLGPHDGTGPMDVALDALVGPGRLAVAAAGNAGDDLVHAELHVPPGGSDSCTVFVPPYAPGTGPRFMEIDGYYRVPDAMEFTLVTPAGTRLGPFGQDTELGGVLTGEGAVVLVHGSGDPAGNVQIAWAVSNIDPVPGGSVPQPPANGNWTVVARDLAGSPGGGEVDFWMALSNLRDFAGLGPRWTLGFDPTEEVTTPGSATRAITVGSFNTRDCWPDSSGGEMCTTRPPAQAAPGLISYFSSRGPTRDDRQKPELVAPGFVVVSSASRSMSPAYRNAYRLDRTLTPSREHFALIGTSMSAPHVTGALALVLQIRPATTPEEARELLQGTVRVDQDTGPVWNKSAGFGKLDVAALLDTTVVPVTERVLELNREHGRPVLRWRAAETDPVTAFRLDFRPGAESWRPVDTFPGPGPHRWEGDPDLPAGSFRLTGFLRDGRTEVWATVRWEGVRPAAVLGPGVPNPFRDRVRWSMAAGSDAVRAAVFDGRGRRVAVLAPAGDDAGAWIEWDGRDGHGAPLPAGIYWLRLRTANRVESVCVVRLP